MQTKRNAVEENLDEGFRTVRTEANKVMDVIASNKESMNEGFEKILAETKCEWLLLYCHREIMNPSIPLQPSTTT